MSQADETLLEFPCDFPIKVMGRADVEFDLLVLDLVKRHARMPEKVTLKSRASKQGNYLAVTVTVYAQSKPELDAIYQSLSSHPLVLMAL
jgi:putative lipoic acid-binding regulatory protein